MADREYRPRLVDRYLSEVLSDFAAVMVTGARAVGKTTTASQLAVNTVRLDRPGVAAAYRADPDAALRRAARPVLIDEWQEVPAVLGAVKRAVDRDPRPGQYLLTGSVRAQLQNETWAGTGRVVRMNMYGLTEREVTGRLAAEPSLFLTRLARSGIDGLVLPPQLPDIDDYVQLALRGGFPEVAYRDRSERSRGIWMASYLDDLVTRDAALAGQAKDPAKLRRYLNVLALHNAGIPADNTLYAAAAINAKTAAGYDELLTNLFMLDAVPAWGTNRLKRLVKAPKRYLVDTGLAAAAAALTAADVLTDPDLLGRLFDAFATAQLRPEIALMHPRPAVHHLRLEGGRREVDLVVDLGATQVIGLEFKAAATVDTHDARHLFWLRDELRADFAAGAVLHAGPAMYQLGDRVWAVPLAVLWG